MPVRQLAFETKRLRKSYILPLTSVKDRYVPAQTISMLESHEAYVGIASSLVKYEATYDRVIKICLEPLLLSMI